MTSAPPAGRAPAGRPGGTVLVTGAGEILTCAGGASDLIGRIPGGSVLIEDGRVVAAGHLGEVRADTVIDAGGCVVMPGFVDCHTHLVYGGSRVDEYAAACAGLPVPAGAPAGILGTVDQTRPLAARELAATSAPRLAEALAHGTTTVESKSGYGLDPEAERALLDAGRLLESEMGVRVISTYMGAHALPRGVDRAQYVEQVCRSIRELADGAAAFCDVYCDEGYFDLAETRRILAEARDAGLGRKLHLDAYSHTGAAALAAELGAVSVDHLNHTPPEDVELLCAADVTGVVMPLLDFAVAHDRPARPAELWRQGLCVALATDCCPGCHATSMQLAVQHACRAGGLRIGQAIRAATINAAVAVGAADVAGSLEPGKSADLLILDTPRHEDLAYRLGHNAVRLVLREGRVVHARDAHAATEPVPCQ